MRRRRDYKDVAAVMLTIAWERKTVNRVDMLYGSRSSNTEGSALLNRLIAANLLRADKSKKKYKITKDGVRFVKAYNVIMELLPSPRKS